MSHPTRSERVSSGPADPAGAGQSRAVATAEPEYGPWRRAAALLFLTVGGFAIGSSEFAGMGMLRSLASDTLPRLAAAHPDVAAARASIFVWGYAAGVVVGAPIFAIASLRFRHKTFLVVSLGLMGVLTAAMSMTDAFAGVIALRVLAGFPHGAYFGVSAIVASRMMGGGHQARGVAVVLGGLSLANLVGAPAGTWLAQHVSWRAAYLSIAIMFAIAAIGVTITLRAGRGPITPNRRGREMWDATLWRTVAGFALLNAAFFAVMTFIAAISTGYGRLDTSWATGVLAAAGLGMTIGNYAGGTVSDRSSRVSVPAVITVAGLAFAALVAAQRYPLLFPVAFGLVGFAMGFFAPYTQVQLMHATPRDPQLGSSMNSVCGNIGSVVGGLLAGVAVGVTGNAFAAVMVGVTLLAGGSVTTLRLNRASMPGWPGP